MKKILLPLFMVLFALMGCTTDPTDEALNEMITELRKKAEAGDAEAQGTLGNTYGAGFVVPQDYKEAAKWYRKAAEQGNAVSQYHLGNQYANGEGVPKDNVRSYAWYNLSANNGWSWAAERREGLAKKMTPEQIAKAQKLCKELLKKIEANKKEQKKE